jgi:hypothetical protein
MPKVRGVVPNMVNGISQQAPSLRLSSQSENDLNVYPMIVDGLTKRPPSRHLTRLRDGINDLGASDFSHIILRDDNEKYVVNIDDTGKIAVWDFEGDQKTVTNLSSGYLDGLTNPRDDLRALSIADHTFIVNRTKTVVAGTDLKPKRPHEGIVVIKAASYGKTFSVQIDGITKASYKVPDGSDPSHTDKASTENIANDLYTKLSGAGYNTAPWSIAKYHNVIYIKNETTDFDLTVNDEYANSLAVAVKDEVVNFSDLPLHNANGFTVKVRNNNALTHDDYWVEFKWSGFFGSQGSYFETVRPGSRLGIDKHTMPHVLVRESDGTFTFKPVDWGVRRCGDAGVEADPADDTVPDPSFVGQTIEDVFFHRNRLGLLTAENCVLSESQSFYSFFRQTLTAVLDTDTIDVAASHVKVSLLRHAVPFQDVLVLFSDNTQFRLAGDNTLTPANVSARPLTEMSVSRQVRPVGARGSIYFVSESNSFAQLYEYFIDKAYETAEPVSVSSHVPTLVPAGVEILAANPHLNTLLLYSNADPDGLYLYTYYVSNQEKLQSAWVKWQFPGVTRIRAMEFDKSWLTMVISRGDGSVYLERLNMEQGQFEKVFLDRRLALTGGSYNAISDETTFTAPYSLPAVFNIVSTGDGAIPFGTELDPVTPGTLVFEGDLSGETLYFGVPYNAEHEFSELFHRVARQQDRAVIIDGRLQVAALTLYFANSSYFEVHVAPIRRTPRTYTYAGPTISDPDSKVGNLIIDSGRLAMPIMSRSDRVSIKVVNNTWKPFSLTSATWRGVFNPSNRQM